VPVARDYDGDGHADVAVFQPATGLWYILRSSTGTTDTFSFGAGLDTYQLVSADYDGDGRTDPAIYHSPSGGWWISLSSVGHTALYTFGGSGFIAVN
jgi:hypothetical protein